VCYELIYHCNVFLGESDRCDESSRVHNLIRDVNFSKIKAFSAMVYGCISCTQTFLCKTIFNRMFQFNYKHIIDRLPESLAKRVCQRLLHHFKDPIPLESISNKSEQIESYLRHKHKNMAQKKHCIPKIGQNVMCS
jgi:hypothetical protein